MTVQRLAHQLRSASRIFALLAPDKERTMSSNPADTANERMSILPPSLKFKGELTADEDLLIQGQIEGSIKHTQRVTIGKAGRVKANIIAQVIKIEGIV